MSLSTLAQTAASGSRESANNVQSNSTKISSSSRKRKTLEESFTTANAPVGPQEDRKRAISRRSSQKHCQREKEFVVDMHSQKTALLRSNAEIRAQNATLREQINLVRLMTATTQDQKKKQNKTPAAASVETDSHKATAPPLSVLSPAFSSAVTVVLSIRSYYTVKSV